MSPKSRWKPVMTSPCLFLVKSQAGGEIQFEPLMNVFVIASFQSPIATASISQIVRLVLSICLPQLSMIQENPGKSSGIMFLSEPKSQWYLQVGSILGYMGVIARCSSFRALFSSMQEFLSWLQFSLRPTLILSRQTSRFLSPSSNCLLLMAKYRSRVLMISQLFLKSIRGSLAQMKPQRWRVLLTLSQSSSQPGAALRYLVRSKDNPDSKLQKGAIVL